MFYVYVYLDPRKPGRYVYDLCCFGYEPFYVGKGKKNRYLSHLYDKTKHYKNHKIKCIQEDHDMKDYILIIPCYTEQDAYDLETKLIYDIGRIDLDKGPLTNLREGGEGGSISEQQKNLLSEINKQRWIEKTDREKQNQIKHLMSEESRNNRKWYDEKRKDKTFEDIFGKDKAEEIKQKKRMSMVGKNSGEKSASSKLTDVKVMIIKLLYDEGYTNMQLSKLFNVHDNTIRDILKNRTWKHIFPLTNF